MRFLLLIVFLLIAGTGTAQHWKRLGRGTVGSTAVNQIMADTIEDRLLICGEFNYYMNETDTVHCSGIAQWQGERWDSLAHRIYQGESLSAGPFYWLTRFNERLYVSGGFTLSNDTGIASGAFARLNEITLEWEDLECAQPYYGGLLHLMPKETVGQPYLYATGLSWSLCGYLAACVYRYTGSGFQVWGPWNQIPSAQGNLVTYVFDYNGKTYMCGEFGNPIGSGYRYFMRHNGTSWEEVPGWGNGIVKDFTIYRDTLYVVGVLQESSGGPGNGISAFDGEQWFRLGDGVSLDWAPQYTSALSLRWFDDELYVGGQFNSASGIQANGFAKWNRRRWCSLPGFDAESMTTGVRRVESMAVWRDSLYIEGAFGTGLEGQPIRQIAQWIGGDAVTDCSAPVGMHDRAPANRFSVAPNPASNELTLHHIPPSALRVEMRDALGRLVLAQPAVPITIGVAHLTPGLYHVLALDATGVPVAQARVVKQ
ncbi:MAG: T9SS type A sorting domain-containing protein [Flavobacteriales bacterium]|nr:T9SS type A sorting domain-containing protein [Flavobacteriales bacterium]